MNLALTSYWHRLLYRTHQFWHYLGWASAPPDLEKAYSVLNPKQMVLFDQMHTTEKLHCLNVLDKLMRAGETQPDLLVAALLHDVGKVKSPPRLWERVLIVLGKAFLPHQVKAWEAGPPTGRSRWKKTFAIAAQHPMWGAEIATEAGTSPLTTALIRRHQEALPGQPRTAEEQLLRKLQQADGVE